MWKQQKMGISWEHLSHKRCQVDVIWSQGGGDHSRFRTSWFSSSSILLGLNTPLLVLTPDMHDYYFEQKIGIKWTPFLVQKSLISKWPHFWSTVIKPVYWATQCKATPPLWTGGSSDQAILYHVSTAGTNRFHCMLSFLSSNLATTTSLQEVTPLVGGLPTASQPHREMTPPTRTVAVASLPSWGVRWPEL